MGTPPVMHCKSNWQEIDETVLRWPLKCHRYTECTLSDHFSMYTHKSICGTIEMPSSNKINNGLGGWRQKTYCTVRSVSTVSSSFHFLLSLPTLFFFNFILFSHYLLLSAGPLIYRTLQHSHPPPISLCVLSFLSPGSCGAVWASTVWGNCSSLSSWWRASINGTAAFLSLLCLCCSVSHHLTLEKTRELKTHLPFCRYLTEYLPSGFHLKDPALFTYTSSVRLLALCPAVICPFCLLSSLPSGCLFPLCVSPWTTCWPCHSGFHASCVSDCCKGEIAVL